MNYFTPTGKHTGIGPPVPPVCPCLTPRPSNPRWCWPFGYRHRRLPSPTPCAAATWKTSPPDGSTRFRQPLSTRPIPSLHADEGLLMPPPHHHTTPAALYRLKPHRAYAGAHNAYAGLLLAIAIEPDLAGRQPRPTPVSPPRKPTQATRTSFLIINTRLFNKLLKLYAVPMVQARCTAAPITCAGLPCLQYQYQYQ